MTNRNISLNRKFVVYVEAIFELVVGIVLHHVLRKLTPHFGAIDAATVFNDKIAKHLFKFETVRIQSRNIVDVSSV